MTQISLLFHACVIGVEGFATDDEGDYFEGEVHFDLAVDGEVHHGLVSTVKQAAGSRFADPLEVLSPKRYAGPLDYAKFRDCVERYVRDQVTSHDSGRRSRDSEFRVRDLRLPGEATCCFVA